LTFFVLPLSPLSDVSDHRHLLDVAKCAFADVDFPDEPFQLRIVVVHDTRQLAARLSLETDRQSPKPLTRQIHRDTQLPAVVTCVVTMQLVRSMLARLVVVASDGETFVAVPLVHGPQPLPVDLESVLAPRRQRASVTVKSVDVYYSLSWLKVSQELDQEQQQKQQQWPPVVVLAWLAAVQSFVHSLFCCEGARWFSAKKVRLWFSFLILFYQHTPYT
jgi:hypothetical protein